MQVEPDGIVFMGAHCQLAAQRTATPRLHYDDDTAGKIYVGNLGRHLPNTQTN